MSTWTAARKVFTGDSLAKTIMRTSFNNFFVLIVTTLTSILTARMLGVEGKGELAAVLFWPTLIGSVLSFGLPTSLIYNLKKKTGTTEQLLALSLWIQLPASLLAGAVAWICMPLWLNGYGADIVHLSQLYCAAAVPLAVLTALTTALSQGLDRFSVYNGLLFYYPLLNFIGLVTLWLMGLLNVQLAGAVNFAASFLALVWAFLRLRKHMNLRTFRPFTSRQVLRPYYSYGARVYGMELMGTLSTQTDKIVIVALLSPKAFGLYSVVYALSRVFNVVQNAVTNVTFPKVTGMEHSKIVKTVGRAFRISMAAMLIVIVPALFIGRYMLGLLYGPAFLEASLTFYLLSLECIIGGGSWILASAFNALGRPGLVLFRQIVAYAITVGLFFICTPIFGLDGIAIALLVGACVRLAFSLFSFPMFFDVPLSRIIFDKSDITFVIQTIQKKRRKGELKDAEFASHG
ncbi:MULTISPECIES: lipopolysaccharide biosynthesis protein [unclassified Paenibacillus]|uniref:lipopolysaccharide biosynthesis protein n=1 Tax=unclassified Paenibacillus TaxID=185978 RepID=UPI0038349A3E